MRRSLALAAVAVVAGCGSSTSVPADAVAVVGGIPVTRAALASQLDSTRRAYAVAGRPFPATDSPAYAHLRDLAVRLLVDRTALRYRAERLGIEVSAAQVDRRLGQFKLRTFGGDERRYRVQLRRTGMTDAEVRTAIRDQLLAEALRRDGRAVKAPKVVYATGFAPGNSS